MSNNLNNSPEMNNSIENNTDNNIENNEKWTLTRIAETTKTKTTAALGALALATTLNFSSPAEAAETNIPEWAVAVEIVKDAKLTDIPFGSRKVSFRDSEIFVWKNDDWSFSMQVTKMDQNAWTDDIHFEANVAWENYVFSVDENQVLVAEQAPEKQSQYGINYDRMTRGNYILKNIMLSAEGRLAEYMRDVEGYDEGRIKRTLEWIAWIMTRDTLSKPQYETFKNAFPEILTSLSYLDQNRFPNLYKIWLTESNLQQSEIIAERADNAAERADNAAERADRLENIINKLSWNN